MTEQQETDTMEVLKAKAKELGVKGIHLFKSEDALQAKIDEMGTVVKEVTDVTPPQPKRKKAPSMPVHVVGRDERAELVARLEREDPSCKYIFEKGTITDRELAAKGFERTTHTLGNDIVVRTDKDSFTEFFNAKRQAQANSMKSIDTAGTKIKSFTEAPKQGV